MSKERRRAKPLAERFTLSMKRRDMMALETIAELEGQPMAAMAREWIERGIESWERLRRRKKAADEAEDRERKLARLAPAKESPAEQPAPKPTAPEDQQGCIAAPDQEQEPAPEDQDRQRNPLAGPPAIDF